MSEASLPADRGCSGPWRVSRRARLDLWCVCLRSILVASYVAGTRTLGGARRWRRFVRFFRSACFGWTLRWILSWLGVAVAVWV